MGDCARARKRPPVTNDGLERFGAARSPAALAVFLLAAGAGLAGDLASKRLVFEALLSDPALPQRLRGLTARFGGPLPPDRALRELGIGRPLVPGVRLTLSTNPGVVFGLPMPLWAVAVATVLTVALVVYFFCASGRSARWTHVALAMILAGALGNLYDRLFAAVELPGLDGSIRHQVRDFIDCSELYYPYVFNVADALLVVGVAVLMLHRLFAGMPARQAQASPRP